MNENKQEEADDRLWRKHCIEGTSEENPTDKMYYEGFMEAVKEARQEGYQSGVSECPKFARDALSSFKQELREKIEKIDILDGYARDYISKQEVLSLLDERE